MIQLIVRICLIGYSIVAFNTVHAQSERFPFGKVSVEDFEVRENPIDPNANVLILMSYGEVHFNTDGELVYVVHTRYRILNEKGVEEADQSYRFNPKSSESLRHLVDGYTHSLGGDGRVKRTRIGRKHVFFENVTDENTRVKITFPNVAVGSILEVTYTIRYKGYFLFPTWYFQHAYPTIHSEFIAFIPNNLLYVMVNNGHVSLEPREQALYRHNERRNLYLPPEGGTKNYYVAKNVPALYEEPYITTMSDYRAAIQFQLQETQFSRSENRKYMSTWEALTTELLKLPGFGQRMTTGFEIREELESIAIPDSATVEQQARAIYSHVTRKYDVTGRYEYFPDKSSAELFSSTSGNNATISFALLNLLRQAGLDAHPVLISTRDHGAVIWQYPLVSQFNHVLVQLSIGSQTWLLDPVSEVIPFGMLSNRSLNKEGYLVKEPGVIRIPLNPRQKSRQDVVATYILNPDGSSKIDFEITSSAHDGIQARSAILETNQQKFVEHHIRFIPSVEGLESTIMNVDVLDEPLTIKGSLVSTQFLETIGEMVLLRPSVLARWNSNPFLSPTRAFPVNFGFEIEQNISIKIHLPEGYQVESLPATKQSRVGQDAFFQSRFIVQDSTIIATYSYRIMRTEFTRRQYTSLREFFSDMVDIHSQAIVLRRKE